LENGQNLRNNQVDAVAFVTTKEGKIVRCGLLCPDLLVFPVENKAWTPDLADARMLKEHFDKVIHEWNFNSRIAEMTSDSDFPTTYLILDTRTHRRGVLQILGTSDKPRGVKISYRLIEGAAVKKITQAAQPSAIAEPCLQFRLVADANDADAEPLPDHDGKRKLQVRREILLDDSAVASAEVSATEAMPTINVTFTEAGSKRFAEITGTHRGRQLAIVFDGKVLSAPTLQSAITDGHAQITGNFKADEAQAIVNALTKRQEPKTSAAPKPAAIADPLPTAAKPAAPATKPVTAVGSLSPIRWKRSTNCSAISPMPAV
jgi:hypothetical protein